MAHSLVTGGLGFVGSHLVDRLVDRGDSVRVLDLAERSLPRRWMEHGVEVVRGNITDPDAVRRSVAGVDTVYHVAAKAGLWAKDPSAFERVNRTGARVVFEEAQRAGAERAVLCSSEVTMKSGRRDAGGQPIDERVELGTNDMIGPYARGKLVAEQEARAANDRGFPVVIVNPTVPVGPGDRNLTPPARMLLGFLNGRFPAYLEAVYDMVDVRDVATGHIRAVERGTPGERYLLSGETIRMSEVLALLEEITGRRMPRVRIPYWLALATAHVSEFLADHLTGGPPAAPVTGVKLVRQANLFRNDKARRELGMEFGPVRDALRDAVAWFVEHGHVTRPTPRAPRAVTLG